MKTRQLLSVGIDIGTTTTQVIFSRLELVNRAAVSQVPRYEFIKREISWQSPVFFTPVDKQGGLKEAELKALILIAAIFIVSAIGFKLIFAKNDRSEDEPEEKQEEPHE